MPRSFYLETLGCPKNVVDSEKIAASLLADGFEPVDDAGAADLVVVNTCAFVEEARRESIEVILGLADERRLDAKLVVTGCLAERYGDELGFALPEATAVVGFGGASRIGEVAFRPGRKPTGVRDLLELPRRAPSAPWAYVKVAEGCDRTCSFCAIPSFRGAQRSRTPHSILGEARDLVEQGVVELVLVAQDLASYGRDVGERGALAELLRCIDRELAPSGLLRVRLLYLYPSEVHEPLLSTMLEVPTVVAYFDLSLQHAAAPLLRRMRRPGGTERFVTLIERIRSAEPDAAFRSSFIVGFPGETEAHHQELLAFLDVAQLDWAGFFPFSLEDGTPASTMEGAVVREVVHERLRECEDVQAPITQASRDVLALAGAELEVVVDGVDDETGALVGRTHREAPEIDGVVVLEGAHARPGTVLTARAVAALGFDLVAEPVAVVEG